MKRLKKILSVAFASLLCCGMFACGGDNDVDTTGWVNESGEEPITLTWYADIETFNKEFGNNMTDKEIFRKTGIKLKFSNADKTTGSGKLQTMMVGKKLTDLISTPAEGTNHVKLITGNYIWDMKSLFDTYTSVNDFVPADMYEWCSYRSDDANKNGRLYGIRTHYFGTDVASSDIPSNMVLVANNTLLERYGLNAETDFSTMDKLIASLKKVKNGEEALGNNNLIPFFTDSFGQELNEFLAIPREDVSGNYQDWRETDEAKELAVYMNKMYREGLILKSAVGRDLESMMIEERTFLILMNFANSQYYMWKVYEDADIGHEYVSVGPVRNAKGDDPMLTCWTPNGYLATCISKQCKYPERALKLLEFLYSDEGQILAKFGINDADTTGGGSYEIEDGKYYYTSEYYSMTDKQIDKKFGFAWYETLTSRTPFWMSIEGTPKSNPAKFTAKIQKYFMQYSYNTRAWNAIHPTEENSDLTTLYGTAGGYFNWADIVTTGGQNLTDSSARTQVLNAYNKALSDMNSQKLNGTTYQDVKNYMNDRFQSNKQKLGVTSAWESAKSARNAKA